MIVVEDARGWLCIGQASHAWMAGQFARAWGCSDEVCLGVEQHDVGWAEWDLRPERDPVTGLPYSFISTPLPTATALWRRAHERVLTQSPYAALLVSMHFTALFGRRRDQHPDVAEALDEAAAFQAAHMRPTAEADRRRLWSCDFLSLAALIPGWAPGEVEGIQVDEQLRLDPWPFDRPEVLGQCFGRRLTERSEDDDGLRAALERAPWERVQVCLRPAVRRY